MSGSERIRVAPGLQVAWASPRVRHGLVLSGRDAERASGFAPARRAAFQTGRMLVGQLLGAEGGPTGWTVTTADCPNCGGVHGPVQVVGVPMIASISHAEGLVVAAVARLDDVAALGVDVEATAQPRHRTADLAALVGGSSRTVLRRWTRIEAVLKADGRGLRVDPAEVRIARGRACVPGAPPGLRVTTIDEPSGFTVSLAWRPARP